MDAMSFKQLVEKIDSGEKSPFAPTYKKWFFEHVDHVYDGILECSMEDGLSEEAAREKAKLQLGTNENLKAMARSGELDELAERVFAEYSFYTLSLLLGSC